MNTFKNSDVLLLSKRETGKSSALLDLFTRDFGRISVYQKGFYSSKTKFSSIFDIGQELSVLLKIQNEKYYIQEAGIRKSYVLPDYDSLVIFSFILELIGNLPQISENHNGQIYLKLVSILKNISEKQSGIFNQIVLFQLFILRLYGYTGELKSCNSCQKNFAADDFSLAEKGEWVFYCRECAAGKEKSLKLNEKERDILDLWFFYDDIISKEHVLKKNVIINIQKHLNTVYYKEQFYFKTMNSFMEIIEGA